MNEINVQDSLYKRFFDINEAPQQHEVVVSLKVDAQTCFLRFFNETNNKVSSPVTKPETQAASVAKEPVKSEEVKTVEAKQATVQPDEVKKVSLLSRFKTGMKKTRSSFTEGLTSLFSSKQEFNREFFDELETQLIMADVGVNTTTEIVDNLKAFAKEQDLSKQPDGHQQLLAHLQQLMAETLVEAKPVEDVKGTQMILIVGVNGVGKTTTIGKLAHQAQSQGKSVMLAAGDTFRAAAVEQLQVWGERTGVPVVAQSQGSDSASVIFDALQSAQSKGIDLLIADTAGRLHNKSNLMNELQKIVRVVKKINPDAPHKVLLVVDGCTGQNALSQGKEFNDAVNLSGLVVTKLDGTAKGGIVFALSKTLGIPVEYIGIGEGMEDLRAFDRQAYVKALLDFSA